MPVHGAQLMTAELTAEAGLSSIRAYLCCQVADCLTHEIPCFSQDVLSVDMEISGVLHGLFVESLWCALMISCAFFEKNVCAIGGGGRCLRGRGRT